jgi:hypothetical protein
LRFAPERGQLYKPTTKEQQQTEAKVDSCYPVALEKGHPTFRQRVMRRTAPAVQIFIQTTIYYTSTENTVLSRGENAVGRWAVVGIALVTQIFLGFLGSSVKAGLERPKKSFNALQNEISGRGPCFYERRNGAEYLWKSRTPNCQRSMSRVHGVMMCV